MEGVCSLENISFGSIWADKLREAQLKYWDFCNHVLLQLYSLDELWTAIDTSLKTFPQFGHDMTLSSIPVLFKGEKASVTEV